MRRLRKRNYVLYAEDDDEMVQFLPRANETFVTPPQSVFPVLTVTSVECEDANDHVTATSPLNISSVDAGAKEDAGSASAMKDVNVADDDTSEPAQSGYLFSDTEENLERDTEENFERDTESFSQDAEDAVRDQLCSDDEGPLIQTVKRKPKGRELQKKQCGSRKQRKKQAASNEDDEEAKAWSQLFACSASQCDSRDAPFETSSTWRDEDDDDDEKSADTGSVQAEDDLNDDEGAAQPRVNVWCDLISQVIGQRGALKKKRKSGKKTNRKAPLDGPPRSTKVSPAPSLSFSQASTEQQLNKNGQPVTPLNTCFEDMGCADAEQVLPIQQPNGCSVNDNESPSNKNVVHGESNDDNERLFDGDEEESEDGSDSVDFESALAEMNASSHREYLREKEKRLQDLAASHESKRKAMLELKESRHKILLVTTLRYVCPHHPLWTEQHSLADDDDTSLSSTLMPSTVNAGGTKGGNKPLLLPLVSLPLRCQRDPLRPGRTLPVEAQYKAATELRAEWSHKWHAARKWCALEGLLKSPQPHQSTTQERLRTSIESKWMGTDVEHGQWLDRSLAHHHLSNAFPREMEILHRLTEPSEDDLLQVRALLHHIQKFRRWGDVRIPKKKEPKRVIMKHDEKEKAACASKPARLRSTETNALTAAGVKKQKTATAGPERHSTVLNDAETLASDHGTLMREGTSTEGLSEPPRATSPRAAPSTREDNRESVSRFEETQTPQHDASPPPQASQRELLSPQPPPAAPASSSHSGLVQKPLTSFLTFKRRPSHRSVRTEVILTRDQNPNTTQMHPVAPDQGTWSQLALLFENGSQQALQSAGAETRCSTPNTELGTFPEPETCSDPLSKPDKLLPHNALIDRKRKTSSETLSNEELKRKIHTDGEHKSTVSDSLSVNSPAFPAAKEVNSSTEQAEKTQETHFPKSATQRLRNEDEEERDSFISNTDIKKSAKRKSARAGGTNNKPQPSQPVPRRARFIDHFAEEGESDCETDTEKVQRVSRVSHSSDENEEEPSTAEDVGFLQDLVAEADEAPTEYEQEVRTLLQQQLAMDAEKRYRRFFTMDGVKEVRAERAGQDFDKNAERLLTQRQLERRAAAEREDVECMEEEIEIEALVEELRWKRRYGKEKYATDSDDDVSDRASENADEEGPIFDLEARQQTSFQHANPTLTAAQAVVSRNNRMTASSSNPDILPSTVMPTQSPLHVSSNTLMCETHPAFHFAAPSTDPFLSALFKNQNLEDSEASLQREKNASFSDQTQNHVPSSFFPQRPGSNKNTSPAQVSTSMAALLCVNSRVKPSKKRYTKSSHHPSTYPTKSFKERLHEATQSVARASP